MSIRIKESELRKVIKKCILEDRERNISQEEIEALRQKGPEIKQGLLKTLDTVTMAHRFIKYSSSEGAAGFVEPLLDGMTKDLTQAISKWNEILRTIG